jgi:hypothetical protein
MVTKATVVRKGSKKIKTKQVTYDVFSLIIRFNVQKVDFSAERIDLEVPVSQSLFESHLMGSTVMVEYAAVDPRITCLESEY